MACGSVNDGVVCAAVVGSRLVVGDEAGGVRIYESADASAGRVVPTVPFARAGNGGAQAIGEQFEIGKVLESDHGATVVGFVGVG